MTIKEEILKLSKGKRTETYIKKWFPILYLHVLDYNKNFDGIQFGQMIFNIISDINCPIKCKMCKNSVKYMLGKYNTYCTSTCSSRDPVNIKKKQETMLKTYGFTTPFAKKEVREKILNTVKEKYGVDNIAKLNNIKEKISDTKNNQDCTESNEKRKQTNLAKYGVDNIAKNVDVQNKTKQTNIIKYGTEYPLLNDEVKQKRDNTFKLNWGMHPLSFKDNIDKRIKKKIDTTVDKTKNKIISILKDKCTLLNYDHTEDNVEILCNKCKNISTVKYYTILQRRDFSNFCKICVPSYSEHKNKNEKTLLKYKELNLPDIEFIEYSDNMFVCKHISKEHTFEITRKNIYDRERDESGMICTICNPINSDDSSQQIEIKHFLEEHNIDFIYNNKDFFENSKEHLDIYIPTHNLAIEFNGVYWHSEIYKSEKYHLNKSLLCKEKNINLLHIFEDDWIHKKDIVKSIILNKLNKIENRIFGRKCEIKGVQSNDAIKFLDDNHIQGGCKSTYKLGLYFENELVSLMTFGYRYTNGKKEFELIRFCNKINTNVVGASSKLFKYFINNYKVEEGYILSYSELSLFDGKMYEMLGFEYKHLSKPNYFWVVDKKREHRWKFRKDNLIKEGFDPNKTEVEIMHERGYYRIFGCGQVRWEYHYK